MADIDNQIDDCPDDASQCGSCCSATLLPEIGSDEIKVFRGELEREPSIRPERWRKLQPPKGTMEPTKKMCAVNQFVQIMLPMKDPYISTSCELVLVASGPQVPEHFRMMIYCMHMVNQLPSLKGLFVPHTNLTRDVTVALGKSARGSKFEVIGIERVVVPDLSDQYKVRTDFIPTEPAVPTFQARCAMRSQHATAPMYARVKPVEMQWGLIPVEYSYEGNELEKETKIFQVLRVIPQPGFHLMHALRTKFFDHRLDAKTKDEKMVNDVCYCLQQIVNYEADVNYGKRGVWDSSNPNPWTVCDPHQSTSVESLLSPFTVLERILNHIESAREATPQRRVVDLETLHIGGFPAMRDREHAFNIINEYYLRNLTYLKLLMQYNMEFHKNNIVYLNDKERDKAFKFSSVLRREVGREITNLNELRPELCMFFTLENFMKFAEKRTFEETERFRIPPLGVALMDRFLFGEKETIMSISSATAEEDRELYNFVKAHVGEQLISEDVTETKIAMIYRVGQQQSTVDLPKACQSKATRDALKRNISEMAKDMGDEVESKIVEAYEKHMELQLTTTMNGLALDQWMSDRVFHAALITEQLKNGMDACDQTREAVAHFEERLPPGVVQQLQHNSVAYMYLVWNQALRDLNETVRANPLNLNLVRAMLTGDLLTHFGLHNQTWRWMMFCNQVAPCFGHLKAVTQDGHAKSEEVPLTAKPNSVGLNEVVIKTLNFCFEGLLSSVVSVGEEARRALRGYKFDRGTRAGLEATSSYEMAGERMVSRFTSSNFMQAVVFDEALRSANKDLLDGLATTGLPRDSNAGEGTTTKLLKPERGGAYEKSETRQLPGMGWYVVCFATNTNALNPAIGEIMGTLAKGAMLSFPPGAPQSMGLSSSLAVRNKRKRGQATRSAMWTGESMMPADIEKRKYLAMVLSVNGIFTRHLGLMNKSAHSDWEISQPLVLYIDSIKTYFMEHFQPFFSTYLGESCDRQFKGVIARAVASCASATVLENFNLEHEPCNGLKLKKNRALYRSMMAMESSALTLYWANIALLNGFTHILDSKLIIVNQLIRWRCNVPIFPLDFVAMALEPGLDFHSLTPEYKLYYGDLKEFLQRMMRVRERAQDDPTEPIKHYQGNYIQVPGVGTAADYAQIESYLVRFCGINPGSKYTYTQMFQDVASKCLDLTVVFDLTQSMLGIRTLFDNVGVQCNSAADTQPGGFHQKGDSYLIRAIDQDDAKAATPTGKIWVHVPQLLVLTALIGNVELHADNSIHLAKNIMKLVLGKTTPQQAVPTISVIGESFSFRQGDVIFSGFQFSTERQYFFRPQICYGAWREGCLKELNKVVGNHPLEDVIHIHAWVQTHITLLGKPPTHFYYLPMNMYRAPELVAGRIYPLLGRTVVDGEAQDVDGAICICPDGAPHYKIRQMDQVITRNDVRDWHNTLEKAYLQAGPLIFREHAAIEVDGKIGVIQMRYVPGFGENYLDWDGKYQVHFSDEEILPMHWRDAHAGLVQLGAFMSVKSKDVELLLDADKCAKIPPNAITIVGWLRFPDDCHKAALQEPSVWVAFRVAKAGSEECDDVAIIEVPARCCTRVQSKDATGAVDYLLPL
jgi:hypothetical protein